METSLRDGEVRWVDLANKCLGVTAWGSRLVVYSANARLKDVERDGLILGKGDIRDLSVYDSFDALREGPIAEYQTTMQALHLATVGERLYGARHSAHQLDVFDWASGQDLPPLELVGYDDGILGLGVTNAEELALFVPGAGAARGRWEFQARDTLAGNVLRTFWGQDRSSIAAAACGGALSAAPPKPPAPPPPVDPVIVQSDCRVSSFDSGWSGPVEVHVVSVYQPDSSGVVEVLVERPGSVQLVLSAYEATEWHVSAGPDTQLVAVAVSGYERQALIVPDGVPSTLDPYPEDGTRRFGHASAWDSSAARRLRASVERELALPMRSFSGCYEGRSFALRGPAPAAAVPEPNADTLTVALDAGAELGTVGLGADAGADRSGFDAGQ